MDDDGYEYEEWVTLKSEPERPRKRIPKPLVETEPQPEKVYSRQHGLNEEEEEE